MSLREKVEKAFLTITTSTMLVTGVGTAYYLYDRVQMLNANKSIYSSELQLNEQRFTYWCGTFDLAAIGMFTTLGVRANRRLKELETERVA